MESGFEDGILSPPPVFSELNHDVDNLVQRATKFHDYRYYRYMPNLRNEMDKIASNLKVGGVQKGVYHQFLDDTPNEHGGQPYGGKMKGEKLGESMPVYQLNKRRDLQKKKQANLPPLWVTMVGFLVILFIIQFMTANDG